MANRQFTCRYAWNPILRFLSTGGSLCPGCTRGRLPVTAGSPHYSTSYAKRTFARSIYQMLCTQEVLADCGRRGTMRGGGRRRRVLTTIVDTVTAGRHRSTRVVTGGRCRSCGRPRRARRLRPGLAAGHHGGRAPGWVQRGHRTCVSISCGQRLGALPVMAPDRFTGLPHRRPNRCRRAGLPDGGGSG